MYPNDPYAYLNIKNYDNNKIENILSSADTISKLSQTINYYSKSQKDGSIAHYLKKYKNVPIWVLINYLNLGELRHMLSQSTGTLQNKVAKDFTEFVNQNILVNTKEPFHSETLNSLLKNINEVRNICAHNNRIIGFKCRQDAKYWEPLHSKYNINEKSERRSVYTVFISLQCFISKTEYGILHNSILKRIKRLSKNLHTISINEILSQLGFPEDWHLKEQKIDQ